MPTGIYKHKKTNNGNGFKKGHKSGMTGKHHSEETKNKMRGDKNPAKRPEVRIKISKNKKGLKWSEEAKLKIRGENNHGWKGNNVSYIGIHHWLYRRFGQPNTCEFCGKTGLTKRKIHWANKSGEYKRDINDWLRLCSSCHRIYDFKRKKMAYT